MRCEVRTTRTPCDQARSLKASFAIPAFRRGVPLIAEHGPHNEWSGVPKKLAGAFAAVQHEAHGRADGGGEPLCP